MAKKPTETKDDVVEIAGAKGELISVKGPEDGRWRAGIKFGPLPVEIDLSTITAEQLEEIEADSYLSVTRITKQATTA